MADANGSCNCGAIQLVLKGGFSKDTKGAYCHCMGCRVSGGALGSFVARVPRNTLEVKPRTEKSLKMYEDRDTTSGSPVLRHFCGDCGSPVYSIATKDPDYVILKVPTFRNAKLDISVELFRKRCFDFEKPYVPEEQCLYAQ